MMDTSVYHVDVGSFQRNHNSERICGDVFLYRRFPEQKRVLIILSDGMGHGVKANVLATLTASMAINFMEENRDASTIAELIMKALPVCSERKICYSTFTILDIHEGEDVFIVEYDNPRCLIIRNNKEYIPAWESIEIDEEVAKGKPNGLISCRFTPRKNDRILFCSDGVTQSGLGSDNNLLGWGRENYVEYVLSTLAKNRDISPSELSQRVVNKAAMNDKYNSKDDTSCGVVHFREPRKLIICTGPPIDKSKDKEFSEFLKFFSGKKIVMGATTTDIIAREWGVSVNDNFEPTDPQLPPISMMEGVDLVTEGVLTMSKIMVLLNNYTPLTRFGKGPADCITKMMLESDEITFLVGTKINQTHQDPSMPVEVEIRKNLIRRMSEILTNKYLKKVQIDLM